MIAAITKTQPPTMIPIKRPWLNIFSHTDTQKGIFLLFVVGGVYLVTRGLVSNEEVVSGKSLPNKKTRAGAAKTSPVEGSRFCKRAPISHD